MTNRSAINTATLNSIVPDVVQRTVLTSRAYAVVYARATVLYRSPVECRSSAQVSIASRALHRSVVSCRSSAVITCTGAERRRSPFTSSCRADINATGTVYPREFFGSPVTSANKSSIRAVVKWLNRSPVVCVQRAVLDAKTGAIFYIHRSPVVSQCRALITIDAEIIKKIPFTGNAPDDRTMVLSAESRLMEWL